MARIATISHRIKIEKGEERPRGRYSQYFTASVVQCKGHDEGKGAGQRLQIREAMMTVPSIRVPIRIVEDLSKQHIALDA